MLTTAPRLSLNYDTFSDTVTSSICLINATTTLCCRKRFNDVVKVCWMWAQSWYEAEP